jgi:hypothetical protein
VKEREEDGFPAARRIVGTSGAPMCLPTLRASLMRVPEPALTRTPDTRTSSVQKAELKINALRSRIDCYLLALLSVRSLSKIAHIQELIVGPGRKLRYWRVSVPGGKRPEYVGIVEAPDQQSAEAAAVKEFKLSDEDRKRLVVRTRD